MMSINNRKNISHSMIIDGGSCANVAYDTLVIKLNLSCIKHPRQDFFFVS
jgi:hypothetical protein